MSDQTQDTEMGESKSAWRPISAASPPRRRIALLSTMGVKAADPEMVDIDTAGLGEGLPASVPALFDRNGQRLISVKALLEEYRARPERRRGVATVQTLSAFIALTLRHQDPDSAVFADLDWRAPKFTTVVDYHCRGDGDDGREHEPRHLDHRIEYPFPLSEEWKLWVGGNGKPMTQGDFAEFVEDRIADLAAPSATEEKELGQRFQTKVADPAEIMQLSRGLQVLVNAEVKTSKVLQSGEGEIVFREEHRDAAGNKLIVPGLFMISVPVFFGGAPVRVPARLRYRPAGGSIMWAYQMWRPDLYVTEQLQRDADAVRVETGLPVYAGVWEGGSLAGRASGGVVAAGGGGGASAGVRGAR